MLKKLLKYDFKEMGRLLLPILSGILLVSVVGKIFLATNLFEALPDLFQVLSITTYVIAIFVCCIGAPIYFVIHFYKSFYSSSGYIVHTLPVTTNQKLISKVISSFVFEILTFAVCILSVMILLSDKEVFSSIGSGIQNLNTQFKAMSGMTFTTFMILTVVLLLIGVLTQLLMFFASVSIGQRCKNHKILGSIGGYMILYVANQILSSILLIALGVNNMATQADIIPSSEYIISIYGISGCLSLLTGALYYLISYYLMEKKLNLN